MTSVALITHREVKILLRTNRHNTEQLINVINIKRSVKISSNYNGIKYII